MARKLVAPLLTAVVTATLILAALYLHDHRTSSSAGAVQREYGAGAEGPQHFVIASDTLITFDSAPADAKNAAISADDAYEAYIDQPIPNGTTVRYGYLTIPLTNPDDTGSATRYAYRDQAVWAYTYHECEPVRSAPEATGRPDPLPTPSCKMWNFLDAQSGEQLVMTEQR